MTDEIKYSQTEIETVVAYIIAQCLGIPTTRVDRADVEAAITEALADKAEN